MRVVNKELKLVFGTPCLVALVFTIGCSGSSERSGNSGPPPDLVLVPEDIKPENIATTDTSGLEIVNGVLRQNSYGAIYVVAVRNGGPVPVCGASMDVAFVDANGMDLSIVDLPIRSSMFTHPTTRPSMRLVSDRVNWGWERARRQIFRMRMR